MALRPGRQRSSATPIITKGLVYPLQNLRASKSATRHKQNSAFARMRSFVCIIHFSLFIIHYSFVSHAEFNEE